MTPEQIQHNCDCFKKQMSKFIDFSEGKALMVNKLFRRQGAYGKQRGLAP